MEKKTWSISASASSGGYSPATGVWAIGRINASASETLAITARVDSFAAIGNTAAVTASDQYDPNSIPGNNDATEDDQASVRVTPQYADLKLAKRVDTNNPTVSNPAVAFTIELFNAGPDTATGVNVIDRCRQYSARRSSHRVCRTEQLNAQC